MKNLIATVALVVCAFCQAQSVIKFSWNTNAGPLNPHQTSPNQMYAQAMLYEPLVQYGVGGEIEPWLAESWELLDDGTRYRFSLRQDVKFANGEIFDANAVKKNFDSVLDNVEKHLWLGLISQLRSIEVVDQFTVDLVLATAYYPALQELTLVRPVRFLAPAAFPDNGHTGEGIKASIGTGPWVRTESVLGVKDVFEQNPYYWGPKPAFDKVEVSVIGDANARALAFESGLINFMYGLEGQMSPDTFARLQHYPDLSTALSQPLSTRLIAMNSAKSATTSKLVRQAINHAIDREGISQGIFYGTEIAAPFLFAPNVPYADVGLSPYQYNLNTAGELLDRAGWLEVDGETYRQKDGETLRLELVYHGHDANQKAVAEVLQANLKQVGIDLAMIAEERSRFYKRQKGGEFDLIFNNTWGAPYDPHSFVSGMRRPSHADYMAQAGLATKPQIDALIDQVLVSTNEAARTEQYSKLFHILHNEAVYLPVSYLRVAAVSKPELGPLKMSNTVFDIPFQTFIPQ